MNDAQKLQWLYDRARIIDVVTKFAVCIDTRDWAGFQGCFAETVTFEYPLSGGTRTVAAATVANSAPLFFEQLDATQHLSANHQIEIDGDRATCVSSLHAQHYAAATTGHPVQVQIGYYRNHLVREGDDWRIARSEQHVAWSEGNQEVFDRAMAARNRAVGVTE